MFFQLMPIKLNDHERVGTYGNHPSGSGKIRDEGLEYCRRNKCGLAMAQQERETAHWCCNDFGRKDQATSDAVPLLVLAD